LATAFLQKKNTWGIKIIHQSKRSICADTRGTHVSRQIRMML
jgi:hypothetical protein